MTAIETGPSTGVFVATFLIPDFKGSDLEVTYYEAKDAASSTVEPYMTQQPSHQTLVLYHLTDQFTQFHGQQMIYLTVPAISV